MFVAVVVSKPPRNAAGRKGMRAWQVHRLRDPEQALQLAEVDEPRPEPGEVVIGVRAAALPITYQMAHW
jgi:Zn-dependent alcohol dehydrogenase